MWLRKGYNEKEGSCQCLFPWDHLMWLWSLFFAMTGAIKSRLSCLLEGSKVKLILSEGGWWWATGKSWGLWPVDCPRYDGLGEGRGRLPYVAPTDLWGKSVATRGDTGWLGNFVTTWRSFWNERKEKETVEEEKERGKYVQQGGCSSKDILVQRFRRTSFRVTWNYISGG